MEEFVCTGCPPQGKRVMVESPLREGWWRAQPRWTIIATHLKVAAAYWYPEHFEQSALAGGGDRRDAPTRRGAYDSHTSSAVASRRRPVYVCVCVCVSDWLIFTVRVGRSTTGVVVSAVVCRWCWSTATGGGGGGVCRKNDPGGCMATVVPMYLLHHTRARAHTHTTHGFGQAGNTIHPWGGLSRTVVVVVTHTHTHKHIPTRTQDPSVRPSVRRAYQYGTRYVHDGRRTLGWCTHAQTSHTNWPPPPPWHTHAHTPDDKHAVRMRVCVCVCITVTGPPVTRPAPAPDRSRARARAMPSSSRVPSGGDTVTCWKRERKILINRKINYYARLVSRTRNSAGKHRVVPSLSLGEEDRRPHRSSREPNRAARRYIREDPKWIMHVQRESNSKFIALSTQNVSSLGRRS